MIALRAITGGGDDPVKRSDHPPATKIHVSPSLLNHSLEGECRTVLCVGDSQMDRPLHLSTVDRALSGAAAGAIATLPMSVVMCSGKEALPRRQQYALPPRQISDRIVHIAKMDKHVQASEMKLITLAAHFGYGSACGTVYAMGVPKQIQSVSSGISFGLGVWCGSYLVLLPGLGLMTSATSHPWERNVLMLFSHAIWGGVLGYILSRRERDEKHFAVP